MLKIFITLSLIMILTKADIRVNASKDVEGFAQNIRHNDLCSNHLCENGGICTIDKSGEAICICVPGFTGEYCEFEFDRD